MSIRSEKFFALASIDYDGKTEADLQALCKQVLEEGTHGLCFSAYEEGQRPGDRLSEDQIRRRMKIIKPYTQWVRSFSCIEGNELIPMIAKENGLKTLVGAWLGDDKDKNQEEIDALINLCHKGYVDIAAVGNEVMYRGDLTEEELLHHIRYVKQRVTNVPIGYVDAYYEFVEKPELVEACDVILANCYPFWEGCDCDYSLLYIKDMYNRVLKAAKGKKVIISETGWPSKGTNIQGAYPSYSNFLKYFINIQRWAKEDGIENFFFSSFDESWKVGAEGDVGAYWGLWDKNEKLKF